MKVIQNQNVVNYNEKIKKLKKLFVKTIQNYKQTNNKGKYWLP
jgi:hypothetical protein